MSYRWSFTVFTQSAVGAFILLLIGGAMGLVAAAQGYWSVLGDVPVWAGRHCRHLPRRATAACAEYAAARRTFADE